MKLNTYAVSVAVVTFSMVDSDVVNMCRD